MAPPKSALQRSAKKAPRVVVSIMGLALGAGIAWYVQQQRTTPPPEPAPVSRATPEPTPTATPSPPPVVDQAQAQSLLESLSPAALFRRALAEGNVVRRWVVVTDNLSEDVSPRVPLRFLAPSRPFTIRRREGRNVIAPQSYQRYDEFADAVASLDVQALAKTYRGLHQALENAYRALGYPDAALDQVTARALQRIVLAPVREGDVAVERHGPYVFADPGLEALGPVEKHLLRMGPRNTRLIQAKAREVIQALGLASEGAGGGNREALIQAPPPQDNGR